VSTSRGPCIGHMAMTIRFNIDIACSNPNLHRRVRRNCNCIKYLSCAHPHTKVDVDLLNDIEFATASRPTGRSEHARRVILPWLSLCIQGGDEVGVPYAATTIAKGMDYPTAFETTSLCGATYGPRDRRPRRSVPRKPTRLTRGPLRPRWSRQRPPPPPTRRRGTAHPRGRRPPGLL